MLEIPNSLALHLGFFEITAAGPLGIAASVLILFWLIKRPPAP